VFQFKIKAFKDLTVDELYAILQLRETVFVVEQNCVYHDIDNIDQVCYHLFSVDQNTEKIIAYTRLVPANIKFDVPAIGRLISDKSYRGKGLGRALMVKSIEETCRLFNTNVIKISAQTYLLDFYSSLGFKSISQTYDEDGIEHVDMLYQCDL
jgi:ElaA protein